MARKKELEAGETPPRPLAVLLDGIPEELQGCAQWVLWTYSLVTDKRGKRKWTKVPVRLSTQTPASSTDPETWSTFPSASTLYARKLATRSPFPGIGFVFAHDDPYCGVDLDDCRDPATGVIEPWAADFIARLASYAEVSPSGTGVKIILRGYVPGGRRKQAFAGGVFECYDCGRFFTVTGQHVAGTPATINEAQDALDAIYGEVFAEADAEALPQQPLQPPPGRLDLPDAELLDRMFASHNGAALLELWMGTMTAHGDDHSAADLSLCSSLAWWCRGDAARVDRLFRQSGLMRPKWDRQNGSGTYGSRTIERALRGLGAGYDPAGYRASQVAAAVQAATTLPSVATVATATTTSTVVLAAAAVVATDGTPPVTPTPAATTTTTPTQPHTLTNFVQVPGEVDGNGRQTFTQRGLSGPEIAAPLLRVTGDWPRRVGEELFVPRRNPDPTEPDGILWLNKPARLFAWASATLGTTGFGNPIQWVDRGADITTRTEFFEHLRMTTTQVEGVELYPHEPARPGLYYPRFPIAGGSGAALDELLSFWTPDGDADRTLLLSALLTLVWGGLPGTRPAFGLDSDAMDAEGGTGVGKTTFAQKAAWLVGGVIVYDKDQEWDKFMTRVLSSEGRGIRVLLLDNVRALKMTDSNLESIICTDVLSGRQLHAGEGRRPNYMTTFMTFNGMQFSRDLAKRVVGIRLRQPESRIGDWGTRLDTLIQSRRWEIIGDLLAILRGPKLVTLKPKTRWANWEQEVLSRCPHAEAAQELLVGRQGASDGDSEHADGFRELVFSVLMAEGFSEPQRTCVFFVTDHLHALWRRFTCNTRVDRNNAKAAILTLRLPEFPDKDRRSVCGKRGLMWRGKEAPANMTPQTFEASEWANAWMRQKNGDATDRPETPF